jgi:hypothetical protein
MTAAVFGSRRQVTVQLWLWSARIMAGTAARVLRRPGECRPPGTYDVAASAGGRAPGRRLSPLPPSLAPPDRSGQAAVGQNRHRRLSAAEVIAAAARRELCADVRAAGITCRFPLRPRNVCATGIRVRG